MTQNQKTEECCPEFDPKPWHDKTHEWQDKLFIRKSIPQIFHIPLPGFYGRAVGKLWKQAADAKAAPDLKDFLMLAYDPSPWKSELYVMVNKEVAGAENVRLSGTYVSKVFDGPFNHVPQYIKEMDIYLSGKDKFARKYYFYFTTCPKCARKYGHNYMVAFAEL
jgi:hypothetical protein